jgi:hypothetical protein
MTTIAFQLVPFRAYAPFTELLLFCKFILEVVFNIAHDSISITSVVKMVALQIYFQSEKQRKVGMVMDDINVVVKNSLVKKGSEMVHCRDEIASSFVAKVRCEVFPHFYAVLVKHDNSIRNWLFGLSGRILCEQSP